MTDDVPLVWKKYHRQGVLPPERRNVLLAVRAADAEYYDNGKVKYQSHAAIVAVGYLRIHSDGPFWVIPGVPHQDAEITHWCDCLGDRFSAPHWHFSQVIGKSKRQWRRKP